jgi:hypothetical protein
VHQSLPAFGWHAPANMEVFMDGLLAFFELRPFFTFFSLRIVWYIYLLHMMVQLYVSFSEVSQVLAQRGISLWSWAPNSLPLVVTIIAQLLLVRVLLEVAAMILLAKSRAAS